MCSADVLLGTFAIAPASAVSPRSGLRPRLFAHRDDACKPPGCMAGMSTLCLRRAGGEETILMTILGSSACRPAVSIPTVFAVLLLLPADCCRTAAAAEPQMEFAAHRAIYELKLAHSHSSSMSAR